MLRIDPGLLTAAGEHCGKQAVHVGNIKSYVSSVCDRPEAFSGVLNLFQGSYGEGINAATSGLANSVAVAERMRTELRASRDDFLDADRAAYTDMGKLSGELGGLPPYEAPDSTGVVTDGGPVEPPKSTDGEEIDGMDAYDFVNGGREHLPESDREGRADPKSPQGALKDHIEDRFFDNDGDKQRVADEQRDRQHAEERQAGEDARDAAKDDGASRAEARDAGKEARRDAAEGNRDNNRSTDNVGDGVGTANDAYNEVNDAIDGVQDLQDGVDELGNNIDEHNDIEDFQDREEDSDLQNWGEGR